MIIAAIAMAAMTGMTSCSSSRYAEEANYKAALEQRVAQLEAAQAQAEEAEEAAEVDDFVEVNEETEERAAVAAEAPKAEAKKTAEAPAKKAPAKKAEKLSADEMENAIEITLKKGIGAGYDAEKERKAAGLLSAKYLVDAKSFYDEDGNIIVFKDAAGNKFTQVEWTKKRVTGFYVGAGAEYFMLGNQGSFGPALFAGITLPYFFIEGDWSMGKSDWHKERSVNTGSYTSMKAGVKAGFRLDLSPKGGYKEKFVISVGAGYLWHINKAEEANGDMGNVWADTWGGCPYGFIQVESLILPKAGIRVFGRYSGGPLKDFTFDGGDKLMGHRINVGITWTPSKTHDSDFKKEFTRQLSQYDNNRLNEMRRASLRR